MDSFSLEILEYEKIKGILSSFAKSYSGKEKIKNIKPSIDIIAIKKKFQEISELKKIIQTYGSLPLDEINESDVLNKIEKSLFLIPDELLYINHILKITKIVKNYFLNITYESHALSFWKNMDTLNDLVKKINQTIDDKGEILDDASQKLAIIRKDIFNTNNEIKSQLNDLLYSNQFRNIFQDNIITIRNKRFVVPVKEECKKKIPGIIQDESRGRATVFIEPMEIIEKNNRLQELFVHEKQEIDDILINLTNEIKKKNKNIIVNFNTLTNLDVINAKVIFAQKLKAKEPELNANGIVKIVNGRHPLLILNKKTDVVPISISIGEKFNILVLSGANTGGKTASLKLVGLVTLMAQSGLFIPCEEGTLIGVFEQIWADIGDSQSLEKNLSTFSSHILSIKQIIDNLKKNSLVLLDEICADTDPEEGTCLAFSVIKYLSEMNVRVIVTTHFHSLKILALSESNMHNASVEFDDKTLKPTYHIIMGNIGGSETLKIAENLGLGEKIISLAKSIKQNKGDITLSLLKTLNERESALEIEKKLIAEERKKINEIYIEQNEQLAFLKKEIKNYKTKYNLEFKTSVKEMKTKLQSVIKNSQNIESKSKAIEEFDYTIKEYDQKLKKELPSKYDLKNQEEGLNFDEIQIGDKVRLLDSNQIGEVISKEIKDNTIKVKVNNIKFLVSPKKLEKISSPKIEATGISKISVSVAEGDTETYDQLNIIGYTSDEANNKIH
ncbi:MAG: hypothetical protein HY934_07885 [Candidatus Firestonebacteria bacterium]|nr:hypothetical protein [Candidatus Firestonebacteria bacterium]